MAKRKTLSKKSRFEVFKRDGFKCQYCGQSAPDVILHVDHIKPVSKGGDNEIINLITSCQGCNSGKSDTEISDDAAITKQRAQLEELNQRREQLEMILRWREGLKGITQEMVDAAQEAFEEGSGFSLNEAGRKEAKSLIRKHGLASVLEAIDIATDRYLKRNQSAETYAESVSQAWQKVGGICRFNSQPDDVKQLYYVRGIVRNRMYCNEWRCIDLLREANDRGASVEDLKALACQAKSWTAWQDEMESLIESMGAENA